CRISAITTFQQVASAGAYDYMAMNHISILDSALLQRTYDHYVHFVVKSRFDRKQRMAGAMKQQAQKKAVNKNHARLRDARLDYAILTKLPMRYFTIIQELGANSEDESVEGKNFRVIPKLPYHSLKANIFFAGWMLPWKTMTRV
ncbi:hypothetical protein O181_108388, partial [Austropuccinia psidii MF-1]|nr:hypothetical protein [Austropuccinia psidii MF-1]